MAGKIGLATGSVLLGGTAIAAATTPESTPPMTECKASTKQETETKTVNYSVTEKDDPSLEKGKANVVTEGKNGENKLTYDVTEYSPAKCEEITKELAKEEVINKPVEKVVANGTYVAPVVEAPKPTPPPSNCNPNYSGCVPNASDVDCAGGSGNGPAYVQGPVTVIGTDVYGLDRDGNGLGCE